jgi:hypothetical protein
MAERRLQDAIASAHLLLENAELADDPIQIVDRTGG